MGDIAEIVFSVLRTSIFNERDFLVVDRARQEFLRNFPLLFSIAEDSADSLDSAIGDILRSIPIAFEATTSISEYTQLANLISNLVSEISDSEVRFKYLIKELVRRVELFPGQQLQLQMIHSLLSTVTARNDLGEEHWKLVKLLVELKMKNMDYEKALLFLEAFEEESPKGWASKNKWQRQKIELYLTFMELYWKTRQLEKMQTNEDKFLEMDKEYKRRKDYIKYFFLKMKLYQNGSNYKSLRDLAINLYNLEDDNYKKIKHLKEIVLFSILGTKFDIKFDASIEKDFNKCPEYKILYNYFAIKSTEIHSWKWFTEKYMGIIGKDFHYLVEKHKDAMKTRFAQRTIWNLYKNNYHMVQMKRLADATELKNEELIIVIKAMLKDGAIKGQFVTQNSYFEMESCKSKITPFQTKK